MDLKKRLEEGTATVMNLKKEVKLGSQQAEVKFVIDDSGSMGSEFANGNVQTILERIFPICKAFDNDGELETYVFDTSVKRAPNINDANIADFVKKKMPRLGGGTRYAPAIKAIIDDYIASQKPSGGILGMFSKKTEKPKLPVYVVFIADGNCSDDAEVRKLIIESCKYPIFWQFVGLKTSMGSSFELFKSLDTMSGRPIDNANFFDCDKSYFAIENRNGVQSYKTPDSALYSKLLAEFPEYVEKALDLDLID